MSEKKLLVATGISSALGQCLMAALPADWRVLALGRQPVSGDRIDYVAADFRNPSDTWAEPLRDYLVESPLRVFGLVHAAGLVFSDSAESTTASEWADMLAVNLGAAFQLGQMLSAYMQAGSSVVLIGSVDSRYASQEGPAAAYGAAKAGLFGLVRHWAAEWGHRNIRANGVALGALTTGNGPASSQVVQELKKRIALGRLGNPDEAARVIAFLLSEESSYVTGAWIPVDGGLNLSY